MATQKALWLPKVGAEFTLGKNEIPEPGPGEVLVKLEASALNPLDWRIQQSGFFMVNEYPTIAGEDAAGVVQKVGDGVTNLLQGDKVFFQAWFGKKYAAYQEYCLANAAFATKIPPNVSFEQAASISSGFLPFAVATYTQKPHGLGLTPPFEEAGVGKYANKPIFIVGGAASLGQYAIQLAKLSGFSPIITTASLHNKDLLLSLGATHVLDRTLSDSALKERVSHITDTPLTYVFDAISSKETQRAALALVAPGGILAVVTPPQVSGEESGKHVFLVIGASFAPPNHALSAKFSIVLTRWLEAGLIKPNRVEVLPGGLNGIASGLKRLGTNSVSGMKLVVRPTETADY